MKISNDCTPAFVVLFGWRQQRDPVFLYPLSALSSTSSFRQFLAPFWMAIARKARRPTRLFTLCKTSERGIEKISTE